jgi:hypothetical protein
MRMIERVAGAINRTAPDGIEAQDRAAIEAMREPSTEMLETVLHEDGTFSERDNAFGTWRAMIDAALSEKG